MSLAQRAGRQKDHSSSFIPTAIESLTMQSSALMNLAGSLGGEFDEAVRLILGCKGRVIISGMGKSGIVGKKMAATFASTGTPSFYVHPGEAFHGDLGMITSDDLIIMISYSGETEEVIKLIPSLKYFGNRIIAMVGADNTTLGAEADVTLRCDIEREVCPNNLAPTTSSLAIMALGDALAVCLIQARDFKPSDFAQFHPGGMLGRRLLARVADTMITENLPIIGPEESVRDAIFCMTSGRLGLAIVTENERLLGILTDGDLRRALIMDASMLERRVRDFMTPVPVTISSDAMITDAEVLMRRYKIRALVVTSAEENERDRVVGLLEIFANAE
ncbi:MAG: KpsF/GutQ family sugar-phosphate isomerase [Gammaproteobacteria bacterium]|nr:MAG: KpsF/GutQ family sugar-phosphate isomerase [Gammaproteobacteria bacterium]PIE36874.1 MAG: KpsF/GutQ family sugar-phosphate isomerase [Gammaproteobacteria bacterium]